MKTRIPSILWGLALIITGGVALAYQMGYLRNLGTQTWLLIFAGGSIVFFAAYFLSGIQSWGWLFPACIMAALAGTLFITESAIADEWIPTLILGSIAIPFLVAYLLDRSRWGLLIPAFILGFVAFIPPITTVLRGELIATFILAGIGLPFIATYVAAPKAWWAIIPGGILLSIGIMIALTGLRLGFDAGSLAVAIMFVGWALTFLLVWLRRSQNATGWAKYPALVFAILSGIMFLVTTGLEMFWSIGLIVAGLALLLLGLRKRAA